MITRPDGTFDLDTGKPEEKTDGYQFAFQTTDSEKPGKPTFLTDEQYDTLVEEISTATGSKPYLGNFDVPEISFHTQDINLAKSLAFGKYNQHSIWNWRKCECETNDDLDTTTNSVYN